MAIAVAAVYDRPFYLEKNGSTNGILTGNRWNVP